MQWKNDYKKAFVWYSIVIFADKGNPSLLFIYFLYRLWRKSVHNRCVRILLDAYIKQDRLQHVLSSCSTSLPALLALSQAVVVLAHETKGMVYVVFFCQARTQGPRTTAISTSFVLFLCNHWLRSHISFPSSWLSTHSILLLD